MLYFELLLSSSSKVGGASVGISLVALSLLLTIPPKTLLKLILSIRSFLYCCTQSFEFRLRIG